MNLEHLSKAQKERIVWIDYFKAIAIILMVIGHICGKYNMYIYQFHMAAFFFISGYCMNWKKGGKLQIIWEKFYSLIFPLIIVFVFGAITMIFFHTAGIYEDIWLGSYIGFAETLKQFFIYDRNYVWWMGACWFIEVLFYISIFHAVLWKLIEKVKRHQTLIFFMSTLFFYFVGLNLAQNGTTTRNIDLILIGSFFYGLGTICKTLSARWKESRISIGLVGWTVLLITTVFLIITLSKIPQITVDYPSRTFHHLFLNILAAINGIVCVISLSKIGEAIFEKIKVLKKFFMFIGQNTIGVVFFHFCFFKLCMVLLMFFGVVDYAYLKNFTPDGEIGERYLLFFLIVSLFGSIGIWKLITCNKAGKIIMGEDKEFRSKLYTAFINKLSYLKGRIDFKKKGISIFENIKVLFPTLYQRIIGVLFGFFIFWPLTSQGIILNDELQFRFTRKTGLINLLISRINGEIKMGRPLRIAAGVNETLNFLTNNMWINRIVQIGILLVSIVVFGLLVFEIFQSKKLAKMTMLFIVIFLPITVEHSVPNAFIGLCAIPVIWLGVSVIAWCRYLLSEEKSSLFIAMVAWGLALLGYEYMVTYTPLFLLLYINKKGKKNISIMDAIKKCIYPISMGVMYIVGTFGFQKISGSTYNGASIGFVSLESSFNIIKVLVMSSIPGYFWFNSKYQYLMYLYTGEKYVELTGVAVSPSLLFTNEIIKKQAFEFFLTYVLQPRIIISALAIILISWKLLSDKEDKRTKRSPLASSMALICIFLYLIIPILPNSIAEMYQGIVTENFFTSLPVSLLITFTMCLLISYCLIGFINIITNKYACALFVVGIIMVALPVQVMNGIIGGVHAQDFRRLEEIESLFETNCIRNLDNSIVYSRDMFETKNLLAVHADYWDQWALYCDLNIHFITEGEAQYAIYYTDESYFTIIGSESVFVLSRQKLPDEIKLQIGQNEFILVTTQNYLWDNGYLCYTFPIQEIIVL